MLWKKQTFFVKCYNLVKELDSTRHNLPLKMINFHFLTILKPRIFPHASDRTIVETVGQPADVKISFPVIGRMSTILTSNLFLAIVC